jgi:DNA-binding SARP family transcriptional activator
MAHLRVAVLGHLAVEVDGQPIKLSPINARLLIRLLIADGRPVTAEQLYRDVWGAGTATPVSRDNRTSVQKRIGELRKIFDPANPGENSVVIQNDQGAKFAYRLVLGRNDVDIWEFTDLVAAARRADPREAMGLALRALALYRDRPFIDVEDYPFVVNAQRQCTQLKGTVQRRLLTAYVRLNLIHEARDLGLDLLVDNPSDVDVHALLDEARGRASTGHRVLMEHAFKHARVKLVVAVGDLFTSQQADLVVGFTDTFDTSIVDDVVISRHSMQGQLLQRLYAGDQERLDQDLQRALELVPRVGYEAKEDKPLGKRVRYPIGSIAVLKHGPRRVFCMAYSRMGNDLIARSTIDYLENTLSQLWEALYRYGQFGDIAMPLVGSGLSRISSADHQELLEFIVRSFVAASRVKPICRELHVVLSSSQVEKISVPRLHTFLSGFSESDSQ